jgi:Encapsulating protein for peroxidase
LLKIAAPGDAILARQREVKALIELRVPFELDRQMIDDLERGANGSDCQPAKDAAKVRRLGIGSEPAGPVRYRRRPFPARASALPA